MKFDEKTGYLTLPGLRERVRLHNGSIQGESGWSRVATAEEEAMGASLMVLARSAQVTHGAYIKATQDPNSSSTLGSPERSEEVQRAPIIDAHAGPQVGDNKIVIQEPTAPPSPRVWTLRGRICPVNTEVIDGPPLSWDERVRVVTEGLLTDAIREIDAARARIRELEGAAKRHEAGWADVSRRLENGTLHVGYCNGSHEKEVGAEGMICNCYLGRVIHGLRRRIKELETEPREVPRPKAEGEGP